MAKTFTCTNCGAAVQETDSICPECGVVFVDEEEVKERERLETKPTERQVYNVNTGDDIENTINFFLLWSKIVNIIWIVVAVLVALCSLMIGFSMNDEGIIVVFIGLVIAAVFVFMGKISERSFKWKAYILKTNYKKK